MKLYDVHVNGEKLAPASGRPESEATFIAREVKAEFPAARVALVGNGKHWDLDYNPRVDVGRSLR